jgi:hypothetical protein
VALFYTFLGANKCVQFWEVKGQGERRKSVLLYVQHRTVKYPCAFLLLSSNVRQKGPGGQEVRGKSLAGLRDSSGWDHC